MGAPGSSLAVAVGDLEAWCPRAVRFLGLPPGWRFLTAGEYEEAWEDNGLLNRSDIRR